MIVRIVLYVIAALLLAAHFWRSADFAIVAVCAAAPLLFLYRRRASLVVLQLLAYGAAAVWLLALLDLVHVRQQMGRPWTTAAIILGAVAAFTVVAGALLNGRALRARYP